MSNRDLYEDGRDVFTWTLDSPPVGTPEVELNGAWHALSVDEAEGSINVHGTLCDDPEGGSVEIPVSQTVRVQVDDVIRSAGYIRVLPAP